MAVSIWKGLLIDRIHMCVAVGGKDLYGFVLSQVHGMKDIQAQLVPHGKIMVNSKKYHTRMDYYPKKNKDKIADIEIGTTKSKHKYFKLGLYPSKFGPGEFEHFKYILEVLLPEFNYPCLYNTSKVSYIELAADSLSITAHSFIPFRARCNCSKVFHEQDGSKGTTYVGSETSKLMFRIYDKFKQLMAKNLPAPYKKHTRIEARCGSNGLSPCDLLSQMVNPFEKLEVADLLAARNASKAKEWQSFLDQCLIVGSAKALAQHPKQRKNFMCMLRAAAVWWWNPQHVWKGLPRALCAIAP